MTSLSIGLEHQFRQLNLSPIQETRQAQQQKAHQQKAQQQKAHQQKNQKFRQNQKVKKVQMTNQKSKKNFS